MKGFMNADPPCLGYCRLRKATVADRLGAIEQYAQRTRQLDSRSERRILAGATVG